jgi:hypothetical protein
MKYPKLKRFQHEEPKMVHGSPNGYVKRWAVYEADAKKAIEKAYKQGREDALREARAARS